MTTALFDRQYTVLIVEDDPVNISIIADCLRDQYELYIAKTRERAFQILAERHVDVVLLDINLPDGNGFDICRSLISNKTKFNHLSVMFMTGLDRPEDEARGLELGARDYITKPINATVLLARIKLQVQLLRQTELLNNLARIDGLTELNNRRAFNDQLSAEFSRARRDGNPLALCLLDIDFFKQYNDHYGHPAGDQCLKTLASCLNSQFQRSSDFIARYGGEEFAVIIAKGEVVAAKAMMQDALQRFKDRKIKHEYSGTGPYVTFSAGICCMTEFGKHTEQDLLNCADAALYAAKAQGKNQVVCHSLTNDGAIKPIQPNPKC